MEDYLAITVSSEFEVDDPGRFKQLLARYDIEPLEDQYSGGHCYINNGNVFSIYGYESISVYDEEADEYYPIPELIQKYLAPEAIAVFKEIGHTKLRYDEAIGLGAVVTRKTLKYFHVDDWIAQTVNRIEYGRKKRRRGK